jgi:hypothetical protein
MSAPVREPDDGPSKDGPSNSAPKQVRHPERDQVPAGAHREGDATPQNAAPEPARTPWKRSKRNGPFAGDVAIVELRNRLALAPDRLPEPPPPSSAGLKYRLAVWFAGVAVVAAVGVAGYRLAYAPPQHPLQSADPPSGLPAAATAMARQSGQQKSRDAAPSRPASGQLTIGVVQPQRTDEAARLTVSVADAGADAAVVIGGLAPGSTLSTGTQVGPNVWRLPVDELAGAAITPPRGFAGAIDLTLELRLAGNTVADRKNLRLEWSGNGAPAPAGPQPWRLDADEIALMIKSGGEYMANGNIGAARMMFKPAAEAGDPLAAFALAETYDPLVLRELNAKGGITADVGLAQTWYQKARVLGSVAATERLGRLARLPD